MGTNQSDKIDTLKINNKQEHFLLRVKIQSSYWRRICKFPGSVVVVARAATGYRNEVVELILHLG